MREVRVEQWTLCNYFFYVPFPLKMSAITVALTLL